MYLTAPITNISKCSLHDGPGIRTVIYFKGCGLRCKWCHNPETLSAKPEILFNHTKCIHCGKCIEICPEHHIISGDILEFVREGCIGCGNCAKECPSLALSLSGDVLSIDEIYNQILKDAHYYKASGGGVTFSGGECLLYPDFISELAKKCKDSGINTAVESALFVPWENIDKVHPYIDLFYADLKIADPKKHTIYTGKDNQLIIENIRKLSKIHSNIVLRIPVIPGINDSNDDFNAFSDIINSFSSRIKGVELLKYNNLASSKYTFSGKEYTNFSDSPQNNNQMSKLCQIITDNCNIKCYFV